LKKYNCSNEFLSSQCGIEMKLNMKKRNFINAQIGSMRDAFPRTYINKYLTIN